MRGWSSRRRARAVAFGDGAPSLSWDWTDGPGRATSVRRADLFQPVQIRSFLRAVRSRGRRALPPCPPSRPVRPSHRAPGQTRRARPGPCAVPPEGGSASHRSGSVERVQEAEGREGRSIRRSARPEGRGHERDVLLVGPFQKPHDRNSSSPSPVFCWLRVEKQARERGLVAVPMACALAPLPTPRPRDSSTSRFHGRHTPTWAPPPPALPPSRCVPDARLDSGAWIRT